MNAGVRYELEGRYKVQVVRPDGSVRQEVEFDNLITNTGLDFIANPPSFPAVGGSGRNVFGYCYLGTGTTTPAYTDTKLGAFGTAQSINGQTSYTDTYVAGSPTIWQYAITITFSAGVATGTWSEIGVGPVGAATATTEPTGAYLFSHALIVDGVGSPTTISVLSSEQLVVVYTLQLYITNTDVTYTPFLINTTSTSGTLRPSSINSVNSVLPTTGVINQTTFSIYSGATLGSITGVPTGTSLGSNNSTAGSYIPGTYTITQSATWPASGSLVGTWNSLVSNSNMGNYQFTVSPAIVIGAGASFSLTISASWARH